MVSGILLWRYPQIVQRIALGSNLKEQVIEDIFCRRLDVREEAIELIGQFIARFKPEQFAIINWVSQTGIIEVGRISRRQDGPPNTDRIMSWNMREAVGNMIFDQCWIGEMPRGAAHHHHDTDHQRQPWLICGMSDSYDLWGYLIIHWDHQAPPEGALQELETLSRVLERLLFG